MYLVDTSVLIDFLKGKETTQVKRLEYIVLHHIPFGISAFTYQETLQGAKNQKEYETLNRYLSTQKIYYPNEQTYEASANLFFRCRRSGITIRSTIDTLIATTAIENGLILLCSDKDFNNMTQVVALNIE